MNAEASTSQLPQQDVHIDQSSLETSTDPDLIKCKRCTFRGTIDNFPLKLNGTDRTTACFTCVKKNREESRTKRKRDAVLQTSLPEGQTEAALGDVTLDNATLGHAELPGPDTTLASIAASNTARLPGFPTAIEGSSSPGTSSKRERTRRNVGRSAFPETHLSWYAFTRSINRGDEPIDIHASVTLRAVQIFHPYLNVQVDAADGSEFVIVDGKREALDAAAWALARLVAREIWRITGYRYIYKSRSGSTGNPGRHNSHFHCAQNDAEKRAKRSRVNQQKKRMERFDCGGYLNIITDERDLTQVNVTLTHITAHTRYAERPDELPLEETPWLLESAGLDQTLQMQSDQARSMMDSLNTGLGDHQRQRHLQNAEGMPMHSSTEDHLMQMQLDPTLQSAASGSVDGMQALNAGHQAMTSDGNIPLPTLLSMPNSTTGRLPANFDPSLLGSSLQAAGPTMTADASAGSTINMGTSRPPGAGSSVGQGSQKPIVEGDRVHITPEEYLKYQQAYQVILNQLSSAEGMDAKRYEKVGSMLKWIEQVGKIFEQEKQSTAGGV